MLLKYNINQKGDLESIQKICDALSSPVRVQIMHQLINQNLSIYELAKLNNISVSSMIFHLKILEEAKLIIITTLNEKKERRVVNRYGHDQRLEIELSLVDVQKEELKKDLQSVPVGSFSEANMGNESGIVFDGEIKTIHNNAPYIPNRFDAVSIYLNKGYVEYIFNNDSFREKEVVNLSFALEICSEAPYFNNEYKSDITFYVNGKEILTYTASGDYGGRKGRFTQLFKNENFSEFGKLEVITINEKGVYLGEKLVNDNIRIKDLGINKGNSVKFKIESKEDAKNPGGFNIFGKNSGDCDKDIEMLVTYKNN